MIIWCTLSFALTLFQTQIWLSARFNLLHLFINHRLSGIHSQFDGSQSIVSFSHPLHCLTSVASRRVHVNIHYFEYVCSHLNLFLLFLLWWLRWSMIIHSPCPIWEGIYPWSRKWDWRHLSKLLRLSRPALDQHCWLSNRGLFFHSCILL